MNPKRGAQTKTSEADGVRLLPPTFEAPLWERDAGPADQAVAVLMSGGVDSSVAAVLLQRAGYRIVGITMRIPVADCVSGASSCCGFDAAKVCRELGVPHYFVESTAAFRRFVLSPFRAAYRNGRTPNPCIACNTILKFRLVWDLLEQELGTARLATGHYAVVARTDRGASLRIARDVDRDQSYFIYGVPRKRLPQLQLPLGSLTKPRVREIAREIGLPVAEKPDSMELCFTGGGDYRQALGAAMGGAGPILDLEGNELGRHTGIGNFTVGQRRGLRVASERPLYAVHLDPTRNAVIVAGREALMKSTVSAVAPNYLRTPDSLRGGEFRAKLRSVMRPQPCRVTAAEPDRIVVSFSAPQFAPTPGQHLVLYDENGEVVAGGEIVASPSDSTG
ncbi:MAG: tRNA 2-thiouridine(34) synthase MnmA [Kiritimatiellaeota bacterium]|nr:tRNA 2-thiouridine(34) synthase MnmA [Kiritimatiellota bacterium]